MEIIPSDTTEKVIESLVLRGDISGLKPEERARFYLQMCDTLGLNANGQPFAILKLNGKEILYPTRGATDQLAAIHKLDRRIVKGPEVIDLAGTKLVMAVCEARHPNGRTETSVATAPLTDPANIFMKVETKAKRRATLSILGLGMIDETEVESIPASAKAPAPPVDLGLLKPSAPPALPPPASSLDDALKACGTPREVAQLWIERRAELTAMGEEQRAAAWQSACAVVGGRNGWETLREEVAKLEREKQAPAPAPAPTEAPSALVTKDWPAAVSKATGEQLLAVAQAALADGDAALEACAGRWAALVGGYRQAALKAAKKAWEEKLPLGVTAHASWGAVREAVTAREDALRARSET